MKNKKYLIISLIVLILLIGALIIMFVFKDREHLILADNLKFEINSSVKKEELLSKDNKIKITNGDELVDTSILGNKMLF